MIKRVKHLLTAAGILFVSGCLVWLSTLDGDKHKELFAGVKVGSGVARVRSLLSNPSVDGGSVIQWLPPTQGPPTQRDVQLGTVAHIKNEFGTFKRTVLGDFNALSLSPATEEKFSGEITLFVERPLGNWIVMGFTYVDGRLVKKDWGYLPG